MGPSPRASDSALLGCCLPLCQHRGLVDVEGRYLGRRWKEHVEAHVQGPGPEAADAADVDEEVLLETSVPGLEGVRVLRDGKIVTAGGVMSGIEMSLWLVEQLYGPDVAKHTKSYIAYEYPPRSTTDV